MRFYHETPEVANVALAIAIEIPNRTFIQYSCGVAVSIVAVAVCCR